MWYSQPRFSFLTDNQDSLSLTIVVKADRTKTNKEFEKLLGKYHYLGLKLVEEAITVNIFIINIANMFIFRYIIYVVVFVGINRYVFIIIVIVGINQSSSIVVVVVGTNIFNMAIVSTALIRN